MKDAIDLYRLSQGAPPVRYWDGRVNEHCTAHCWAMHREGKLFHAYSPFLEDWQEAVAGCSQYENWSDVERVLLYEAINKSPDHRNMLLGCHTIAYGIVAFKGYVYLTIRGK